MTIGQLRHNAELHTLQAFVAIAPQARIALLAMAHDAARREEAVARWRGDSNFTKFVPPLHAFAEGQGLSGWNPPQGLPPDIRSPMEKPNDDPARIRHEPLERLCA